MSTSRHPGGVVVIHTQSHKRLAKAARLPATHCGIWAISNLSEVMDDLGGRQGMGKEELTTAWEVAATQPHGFLWLAYNAPEGSKMWSEFTKRLVLE